MHVHSNNIQSRLCFLNARGSVYRPSTLFPFVSFVRSTTKTRDMCPNHDMLYAQFRSGFTFNAILGSRISYHTVDTVLWCICSFFFVHFFPPSLYYFEIATQTCSHKTIGSSSSNSNNNKTRANKNNNNNNGNNNSQSNTTSPSTSTTQQQQAKSTQCE